MLCATKPLAMMRMRPNRLERHLTGYHPELLNKSKDYFIAKRKSLRKVRLDSSGSFHQQSANIVMASYELTLIIAKEKKPHNLGESVVKPCMVRGVELVLGKESSSKISKIALSDNTVKSRIDEMAQDIREQVTEKIRMSPMFAIQCDESTDVAHLSQLMVYARYISGNAVEEELLFCRPLETTTTADDVLRVVSQFFDQNNLSCEKVVGVCTDGAPAMLGSRSGFITKVKQKNPLIVGTHCVIHREALAAKTLPPAIQNILTAVIKVVNYIKNSALNTRLFTELCRDMGTDHENLLYYTSVRWLSKGNMLARVYELRNEVKQFLEKQKKFELYNIFSADTFQTTLAYLVDIFEALNSLNKKLQGGNKDIMNCYDIIQAFIAKLQLWKRRVQSGNFASFPQLDEELNDGKIDDDLQTNIVSHISALEGEFICYFPDIQEKSTEWSFIRNPFVCSVEDVPDNLQEEFLDMKFNKVAQIYFNSQPLDKFWIKYLPDHPNLAKYALSIIVPFPSTYLCEAGFSALVAVKTKSRNRLNVENDIQCALSKTVPRIKLLVEKKQCQPSH